MNGDAAPIDPRREAMVERQLRGRGIADERVLEAMRRLPRELFVPEAEADVAYVDGALPIGGGQTISQPYMVARMTELLRPREGSRILEIGTGSGYQAALLGLLGCVVLSIERQAELVESARERLETLGLADRVDVRLGDGSLGAPEDGPFDGIVVTAAAPRVPPGLRDQLADGGRLVLPVGPRNRQELIVVERDGDRYRDWSDGPCVFVPLVGEGGFPG